MPLNEDTLWRDMSTHRTWIDLGATVDAADLQGITIAVTGSGDKWKIASLELHSPDLPVARWWDEYVRTWALLGTPPAFGTDFNGLELQLDFAEITPTYPLRPYGHPSGGSLGPQQIGFRTADLASEGLSNIGQLPDFIGAVGQLHPTDPALTAPVYDSARGFVQMWYLLESR